MREAKVVDIIKTEELPDEIKYDKATPGFSIDVLSYSEKVKYSEKLLNLTNRYNIDSYLILKLDGYYKEVEDYLVKNNMRYAVEYTAKHKEYHNNEIRDFVYDIAKESYLFYDWEVIFDWIKNFESNDLDKLEEEFINRIHPIVQDVISYAIEYNRNSEVIANYIFKNASPSTHRIKDYINMFIDDPLTAKFAEKYSGCCLLYYKAKQMQANEEIEKNLRLHPKEEQKYV